MAWTDRVQDDVSTGAEAMARVRAMRAKFGRVTRPTVLMPVPAPAKIEATAERVPIALFFDPEPVTAEQTSPEPNAETAPVVPAITTKILGRGNRTRIDVIVRLVAAHYGIPILTLLSPSRQRTTIAPRQMAMHFAVLEGWTLTEIGRRVGGRDHTTVLHGHKMTQARRDQGDEATLDAFDVISRQIALIRMGVDPMTKKLPEEELEEARRLAEIELAEAMERSAERDRRARERKQRQMAEKRARRLANDQARKAAAKAAKDTRTPEEIAAGRERMAAANAALRKALEKW